LDPRWKEAAFEWHDGQYVSADANVPQEGQRPITAFVGGANSTLAVQFVESEGKIVGMFV
jgi:hypothetical protein